MRKWLEKWFASKAEDSALQEERLLQEELGRERERLAEARDDLNNQLYLCAHYEDSYDERDCPVITKKGEEVLVVGEGAHSGLVEVKAGRVTYKGGSRGVNLRVAKGITYRIGAHKGTAFREPEKPRLLCSGGQVVITNQRVVYVGPKYTREFLYSKMVSMVLSRGEGGNCLLMSVNNRQKTSGVVVNGVESLVQQYVEVGLAIFNDTVSELEAELREDLAEIESELAEIASGRQQAR